jgi:hypothetical protein
MKRVLITLAVVALMASTASAAPLIRGFGFSAGYISPEDADGTFGFGAFADIGLAMPSLSIQPYADYWSTSEDLSDGSEASARDFVVGAHGLLNLGPPNPAVSPFIGAGMGLHFTRAEIDFGSGSLLPGSNFDESESKVGFDFGGGGDRCRFGPAARRGVVHPRERLQLLDAEGRPDVPHRRLIQFAPRADATRRRAIRAGSGRGRPIAFPPSA